MSTAAGTVRKGVVSEDQKDDRSAGCGQRSQRWESVARRAGDVEMKVAGLLEN